jgi:hypothetical protein
MPNARYISDAESLSDVSLYVAYGLALPKEIVSSKNNLSPPCF